MHVRCAWLAGQGYGQCYLRRLSRRDPCGVSSGSQAWGGPATAYEFTAFCKVKLVYSHISASVWGSSVVSPNESRDEQQAHCDTQNLEHGPGPFISPGFQGSLTSEAQRTDPRTDAELDCEVQLKLGDERDLTENCLCLSREHSTKQTLSFSASHLGDVLLPSAVKCMSLGAISDTHVLGYCRQI